MGWSSYSMGRGKNRKVIINYGGTESAGNIVLSLLRLLMRDGERCGEIDAKQENEQYRDIYKDKPG